MAHSPPRNRGPLSRSSWRLVACAALFSACSWFGQAGPTAVSQSRYFQTGNVEYDAFFGQLYQTQHQLAESPVELAHVSAALFRRLNLDSAASPSDVAEALSAEAERLAQTGVYLSLTIESYLVAEKPIARHELTVSGTPTSRGDEKLLAEIEDAARELAELHVKLEAATHEIPTLSTQRFELERKLESVPTDALRVTRDAVRQNLADAEKGLPELRKRAFQLVEQCATLMDALERGFDSLRKKPSEPETPVTAAPVKVPPKPPAPKSDSVQKPRTDAFQP
jgi:hypothetical protein